MMVVVATSSARFWAPQAEQFAVAMRLRGHEAQVIAIPPSKSPESFSCDLLLCIGTGDSLVPILQASNARCKILYLIESIPTLTEADDFTRAKLQVHRHYLGAFDFVFVHTRRSIPLLRSLGVASLEELIWPHFPTIYAADTSTHKDLDVLFLGTPSPYRDDLLSRIASGFTVFVAKNVFHEQSVRLYSRAKIILNLHFTSLANFECRVIEVLGCGGFLLTEALDPGDLLLDGEHLVVFDRANVLELVEHFLREEVKRNRIAMAGQAAIQRFSIDLQVGRILDVATSILAAASSTRDSTSSTRTLSGQQKFELRAPPAQPPQSKLATAALPHNSGNVAINGKQFSVQFPNSSGMEATLREVFNDNVYPFLPFLQCEQGVILDVGANVGCVSILFGALYPAKTIYALEPAHHTFQFLKKNTLSLSNIRPKNLGLLDREGAVKLYHGQNSCVTHSIGMSAHNTSEYEDITVQRITTFVAEHSIDHISILKIDCEGAELPILVDAGELLNRVDAIYLEYHSENDRLEIDRLLCHRFILVHGRIHTAHRGVFCYVAKDLIRSRTNMNDAEIILQARPERRPESRPESRG